jgi:hypothetical protein
MQQALENPHFKKIWEEVIMNRHPEAKSLEEGLKMELKHYGCYFFNPNQTMSTGVIVGWDNAGYRYISTEGIDDKKQSIIVHIKDKFYDNSLILGRPITLEDILILLSGKAYSISIPCFASNIIVTILSGGVVTEYFIDWQLGKPIYEQRPETWEQISELINK